MYLRWAAALRRRLPTARHASEQYLTERVLAGNFLPHTLHSRRGVLAASLSAFAVHPSQWARRLTPPYGANVRPHSLHAVGPAIAPRIERAVIRLASRPHGARTGAQLAGSATRHWRGDPERPNLAVWAFGPCRMPGRRIRRGRASYRASGRRIAASPALLEAYRALWYAALAARLSGSALRLRMYSRSLLRLPSALHSFEQ